MHFVILAIFVIGYLCIAFEHKLKIDKASIALLTGGFCWTAVVFSGPGIQVSHTEFINEELAASLAEISSIVFFLLGAMTIVELIDAHEGFQIVTEAITTRSKIRLLWIISFLTFGLSAVLDNLTTTIIMAAVLRKLISDKRDLFRFGGMVVLAANAGGAWSPIGDVTTIMLWAGGQITALNIILSTVIPSIVCLVVPLILLSFNLRGHTALAEQGIVPAKLINSRRERIIILVAGISSLVFVLFFKMITHLPPYLGMLISLGLMWLGSELLKRSREKNEREAITMIGILRKLDLPTLFFFLGILLAVGSLEASGHLGQMADFLNVHFQSVVVVNAIIGILSSVVDNVPLVAGAMGMYSLSVYPTDHAFWELLAYCAGTGGSILIIGSAAGVAIMGILKIDFMWYLKNISWLAFIGYAFGIITYYLMNLV